MVERQADEETPLVQRRRPEQPVTRTPLPWDQFWVVLLVQISDPFATQTLAPFIPQVSTFLLAVLESHLQRELCQAHQRHRSDTRR
jgi:hypothetical protein